MYGRGSSTNHSTHLLQGLGHTHLMQGLESLVSQVGNATSSSSLGIQLDQPAVYAGGVISGKVFLQVRKH